MTSSLVGSEMCIRDRRSFANRGAIALARALINACGEREMHAFTAGRRAVSYTHLTLPTICSV
eukprot:6690488-Prorocentrum_lima.AAC.1